MRVRLSYDVNGESVEDVLVEMDCVTHISRSKDDGYTVIYTNDDRIEVTQTIDEIIALEKQAIEEYRNELLLEHKRAYGGAVYNTDSVAGELYPDTGC